MHSIKVSASEIGEYVYCQNHWWRHFLGEHKEVTEAMVKGSEEHSYVFLRKLSLAVLFKLALVFLLLGIILLGINLLFPNLL